MKIDILCNDGSPLGVHYSDLFGNEKRVGVGGAENALLTMCNYWHEQGNEVTLYNNPNGGSSPFLQKHIQEFNPRGETRDVLINFRSPNPLTRWASATHKIWWTCDQYTVGDYKAFGEIMPKIVTISPFHTAYFSTRYGIHHSTHIDLPVRMDDYVNRNTVDKVPNRFLFCSVPDRGLDLVAELWPRIVAEIPNASLVITSSHSLWGAKTHADSHYRILFSRHKNVQYLGGVKRSDLIQHQLQAEFMFYPCTYEELFCISAAECSFAGALPITSSVGALSTTNMGVQIDGNPKSVNWKNTYVNTVLDLLKNPDNAVRMRADVMDKAEKRFDVNRIGAEWQKLFI